MAALQQHLHTGNKSCFTQKLPYPEADPSLAESHTVS